MHQETFLKVLLAAKFEVVEPLDEEQKQSLRTASLVDDIQDR